MLKLEKLKPRGAQDEKNKSVLFNSDLCISSCLCDDTRAKSGACTRKSEKRLALQVQMAQQCDPVAAKLMSQLPTISQLPPAQRTQFDQQYEARVNNPTFQSCYNMAFKAYNEQQQLNLAELEWDTDAGWFYNSPFNCEFPRPEDTLAGLLILNLGKMIK